MQDAVRRGRPRGFDEDVVLDRVLDLFWRQGFSGTSYGDLTGATGLNKPSLYAAFGDKEALFGAVLDRYVTGPQTQILETFARTPRFRDALDGFFRDFARLYTVEGRPSGCLVVAAKAEAATPGFPDRLRERLIELSEAGGRQVAARIARAVAEGDLPPDTDQAALQAYVAAMGLGMATAARSGIPREALLLAVDVAMRAIPGPSTDPAAH